MATYAEPISPGSFETENHYYPRVLNAHLHPVVRFMMSLGNERIIIRYCHLHPEVMPDDVHALLTEAPKHFRWAGADLFLATNERGIRRMVVVETNSSPSGQKSMPFDETGDQGGYRRLIEDSFVPALKGKRLPKGDLAVLCDKNPMETKGYATTLADATGETVWWVSWKLQDPDPPARWVDGVLEVRDEAGAWHPIRAAFKYTTQKPWMRIPPITKTLVYNSSLVCLAGGRNKLMAAKAYDLMNADLRQTRLRIHTPETIWDVSKKEVPIWVNRMGGVAVVKVPYSNAGQGVYTITNKEELDAFMKGEYDYDLFIVQGLVGNHGWSSLTREGRLYHVGTTPNKKGEIFASDLRFMVGAGPDGWFPVGIYARRARMPLATEVSDGSSSWDMLGTNLSVKLEDGGWATEPQRLMLMDARDFNRLGIGLDDLIEGYVQTVLATTAIDRMCGRLVSRKNTFRSKLFAELNPDEQLTSEVME